MSQHTDIKYRFVFAGICFALIIASLVVSYYMVSDWITRGFSALFLLLISFFIYRISLYSNMSDNRVKVIAITSLTSICMLIIATNAGPSYLIQFISSALKSFNDATGYNVPLLQTNDYGPLISVLTLCIFSIVVALIAKSTQSPTGKSIENISNILPEIGDRHRLILVKEALLSDLDNIDRSTRWSDAMYVPLQAQVQLLSARGYKSRVVDLIEALRRDQLSRIFIVLGGPGSGKSVAMRRLSRDLMSDSIKSRIPIYFNLKEWKIERPITQSDPPTTNDFRDFIYLNLRNRILDFALQDFLFADIEGSNVFEKLREAGHIFFIFDSFDEIPIVLDHDENSWLIERLSNCISSYAVGGVDARGVIASRLFRKPRVDQTKQAILEIRPFTEDKIIEAITRAGPRNAKKLIKSIMSERPDLGHIAKNPFLLNLIISHFSYKSQIPTSQKEIFETYFARNISYAKKFGNLRNIAEADLYEIGEKIALCMFASEIVTLEAPVSYLRSAINDQRFDDAVDFLIRSKIGRISNEHDLFSFSHRRFNEFFLVRNIENTKVTVPLDAIQTDNKWRDALVLYAEIADEHEAHKLALHAWSYAGRLRNENYLLLWSDFNKSRNAIRFIVDGFRNRPWILPMRQEIADLVSYKVFQNGDLIEKRTAIEAITILNSEQALPIIEHIFKKYPGWLSESAATATRYLPKIGTPLALELYYHAVRRPGFDSLSEARRLTSTLSISETTKFVSNWLLLYRFDFYKTLIFLLGLCCAASLSVGLIIFMVPIVMVGGFLSMSITNLMLVTWAQIRIKNDERRERFSRSLSSVGFSGSHFIGSIPWHLKFATMALFIMMIALGFISHLMLPESMVNPDKAPNEFSKAIRNFWHTPEDLFAKALFVFVWVLAIVPIQPAPYKHFSINGFAIILRMIIPLAVGVSVMTLIVASIHTDMFKIIIKILGGISSVFLTYILTNVLYNLSRDFMSLRRAKKQFDGSRYDISKFFLRFRTPYYRMKYVNFLSDISVNYRDRLSDVHNSWENNCRPQISNDIASSELAKLDARWLGLD